MAVQATPDRHDKVRRSVGTAYHGQPLPPTKGTGFFHWHRWSWSSSSSSLISVGGGKVAVFCLSFVPNAQPLRHPNAPRQTQTRRYGVSAMLVSNGGVDMDHVRVASHTAVYDARRHRQRQRQRRHLLTESDTNDPACSAAGCPPGYQGDGSCDEECNIPECTWEGGCVWGGGGISGLRRAVGIVPDAPIRSDSLRLLSSICPPCLYSDHACLLHIGCRPPRSRRASAASSQRGRLLAAALDLIFKLTC